MKFSCSKFIFHKPFRYITSSAGDVKEHNALLAHEAVYINDFVDF